MNINIVQWNIKGYYTNLPHLQQVIDTIKPNIICLQETWLRETDNIRLNNFQQPPARFDRVNRARGGSCVFVENGIPYTILDVAVGLEAAAVRLCLPNRELTICSLYIPPDYDNSQVALKLNQLLVTLPAPLIIAADLNAHNVTWGSDYCDARGRVVETWMDMTGLVLLNTGEPTYIHTNGTLTHIDLTLVSPEIALDLEWQPHHDNFFSDHFPINITSTIKAETGVASPRWKLKTANWSKYSKSVKLPNSSSFLSPTQSCGLIQAAIIKSAEEHVGKTTNNNNPNNFRYTKNWWTEKCTQAIRNKRVTFRQYRKKLGDIQLWIKYRKAHAIARHTILEAKRSSWTDYVSTITSDTSSAEVWSKLRSIRNNRPKRTIILKINNKLITNSTKIANVLVQEYSHRSSGTTTDPIFRAHQAYAMNSEILFSKPEPRQKYNRDFNMKELNLAISSSSSKSPGPDNIPFVFIKNLPNAELHKLLNFYNYIWNFGFPQQWHIATIIPILKPGKIATSPESYRPIALTCCLGKVMERMANWRLQQHLEENSLITKHQSGYRPGHATMDPLARLEADIRTTLIQDDFCLAVFLDITQAFDTVWHSGLLQKI